MNELPNETFENVCTSALKKLMFSRKSFGDKLTALRECKLQRTEYKFPWYISPQWKKSKYTKSRKLTLNFTIKYWVNWRYPTITNLQRLHKTGVQSTKKFVSIFTQPLMSSSWIWGKYSNNPGVNSPICGVRSTNFSSPFTNPLEYVFKYPCKDILMH